MAIEKNTKPEVRQVRRVPLSARKKLAVENQDPNFHYRVVNVIDARVDDFIDRGYEIVSTKVGDNRVDTPAPLGTSQISVGGGTKAVVMRIRKDWYQEDQAYKQSQIEALETDMNNAAKKGI